MIRGSALKCSLTDCSIVSGKECDIRVFRVRPQITRNKTPNDGACQNATALVEHNENSFAHIPLPSLVIRG